MSALRAKDYGDTTYVTGMRAWASLAVLLIHAGGAGLHSLGGLGQLLSNMGSAGVFVFFVISGFSVAASYGSAGGFWRYLFLRFMRLAPLFYAWLLLYGLFIGRTGFWATTFGLYPLGQDLALHLLFLHAFSMSAANSMLGVEWSLSVEMFWYLFLPLLLRAAQRGWGALSVLAGLLVYGFMHVLLYRESRNNALAEAFLVWHPFFYLFSFALGVWAHSLRGQIAAAERGPGVKLALALGVAFWLGAGGLGRYPFDLILAASLIAFMLLIYGSKDDGLCRALFMHPAMLFLGTLSYGLYLDHPFVLHYLKPHFGAGAWGELACFGATLALSAVLAWGGFMLVEAPAQAWSKRVWPLVNKSA